MIKLEVTADTTAELHQELAALLAGVHTGQQTTAPTEPKTDTGKGAGSGKSAGNKRGARGANTRQLSETPENRVGPEDEAEKSEDDAETQAQDNADETADSAAEQAKEPEKLTHDSVRKKLGEYVARYGMAAAQEDGVVLVQKLLDDKNKTKISDIPDNDDALKWAMAGIQEMLDKNPFKRTPVES